MVPEVLDRVGEIDALPVDSGGCQCLVEQFARRSHEGLALAILPVARLLTDEHEFGAGITRAEHDVVGVFPQRTPAALLCRSL
jgi:hypothetical protein